MRTVPDFHQGRPRDDLLFTMSNNTRTAGRTRTGANLFKLLDEQGACLGSAHAAFAHAADRVVTGRPPIWWSQTGSNRRPPACKAGALPTELWPLQGSGISNQGSRKPERLIPDI